MATPLTFSIVWFLSNGAFIFFFLSQCKSLHGFREAVFDTRCDDGIGNRFRFLYAVADDGGEACGFQHAEVVAVIARRHGVFGIDAEDLAERIQCGALIAALFIDLDVIDVRECKLDAVELLQAGQNFRADAFRNEHHIDLFRLGVRFF